jgi:hypothetical protein
MRQVRVGGRYLQYREQRLWAALVGMIVLATVGIRLLVGDPGSGLFHPTLLHLSAGLAAVVTAYRIGRPLARRLRNVRRGRLGERLVTDLLRGLSDDYWLINDVTLGLAHGHIDHVLIGPCGVVVIETKRIAGSIRCWGDGWSVNGYRRKNISRQVNSGACAVRYFLSTGHPELAPAALRWVESIIVFTHPLCRVEGSDARATVVRYSQLYQAVLELSRKYRMAPSTAALLAQTLTSSQEGVDAARRGALTSASLSAR